MTELRAAGEFKRLIAPLAAQSHVERRSGFNEFCDLAEIFQFAIGARDGGATVTTNDDD